MINREKLRELVPALAGLLVLSALAALPSLSAGRPTASQTAPAPQEDEPRPPVRTRFDGVPANDPRREIIQTVLGSAAYTTGIMPDAVWKAGNYHLAWQRAGQYFPQSAYFTTSRLHFLTHFFNPAGFQEIEIFDSDYLRLCARNRGTFTREGIVGRYGEMRAGEPAAAASFSRKLGGLEPYFHDEASKEKIRRTIGGELFDRLLDSLRREGYHMFAGAFLHEGMHALMDGPARVAAIQAEYEACKIDVQWDELRAYMAEINYHGRLCNWAVRGIFANWRRIESLLKQLERLRKKPKPLSEAGKDALEALKARIEAYIALIRLRMREIEDSGRRMEGLMAGFLKDHLKPKAAAAERKAVDALFVAMSNYVKAVGEALRRQELLLKGLGSHLDLWNRWAACGLKAPPEPKIVEDIIKRAKGAKWPAPPLRQAEELRKKSDKEVATAKAAT